MTSLKNYKLEKLNETLSNAQYSVFYRKKKMPLKLNSLDEIKKLPFTTADDIRMFGINMLCVSQGEIEKVVTLPTSGSTGEAKRIFFTKDDLESTIDFFQKGLSQLNGKKMMIFMPKGSEYSIGNLIVKGIVKDGVEPIYVGMPKNFQSILDEFGEADSIIAPPILLYAFGQYVEHKKLKKKLKGVLVSSDYFPNTVREKLKDLFSCEVFDHYGITEAGLGGAVECTYHHGLHIREKDLYFEIVNPINGSVLSDGEFGEIVFTTLTRKGMPLIRYRTGDIGRFLKDKCPCGIEGKLLDHVKGRFDGIFNFHGCEISIPMIDELVFLLPGIIDYTVEYLNDKLEFIFFTFLWNALSKEVILDMLLKIKGLYNFKDKINIKIISLYDWKYLHTGKRMINMH